MNRVVSASVTILFLLSASSVTGLIQVAKATSAPIYIRADGSIDPPTTPISTFDNITYTFTGNIVNGSIVVQKDNIVLDGAGFTIHGDGANGIDLSNRSNVKIENTNVENCNFGIYLENSSNNIISWNNATDNTIGVGLDSSSSNNVLSGNNVKANNVDGIHLYSSSNSTVYGNNVANNSVTGIWLGSSSNNVLSGNNVTANNNGGIELDSSSDNTLSGNNVANNGARGILLYSSSDNTLSGNVMVGNDHNFGVYGTVFGTFGVYGTVLSDFLQSVDTSNLVDGKPVYYFVNQSNIMVNPDAYPEVGYLGFVNCANVTVQGMNLTNNRQGILLAYTNDSEITGNNAANNYNGIELDSSSGDTLSGNNVTTNNDDGILLYSSSGNTLSSNNIMEYNFNGIDLESSSGNTLSNNILSSNSSNTLIGENVTASAYDSIYLYSSSDNTLSGNNVTANGVDGIVLDGSSDNTLSGNNEANNYYGIEIDRSSNNILSGNNFIANSEEGISLDSSSNDTLSGNVMVGNDHNFGVYGTVFGEYLHSIDTSNLVDGKPVYYFVNQSNIMVNPDAYPEVGYLGFVNCVNVTVQGMNLTNNRQGILLAYTNDSEITGNTVTNNVWGIDLESSSNNTLSGNNVTSTSEFGIWLASSSDNFVFHNSFVNNTYPVFTEGLANIWDNGSTGNYWSDYLAKYPNATERGGSGIWNTPYVIDTNNIDHYPLMAQYNTIPEFPSFLILPLIMITALLAVTIYKKSVKTSKLN